MNRTVVLIILFSSILSACAGTSRHHEHAGTNVVAKTTKPGLIHNVYFWLRDDITPEEETTFLDGARSLGTIDSVQAFFMGPHATTEAREVVDHSYDLSLIIHFENQAAQDAYQVDPIHTAFIEKSASAWSRVKVYDVAIE